MNIQSTAPAMSQKIFSMNLGIEATSLYLLCCAVADTGVQITKETIAEKWNGDMTSLNGALARLEEKNIIRQKGTGDPPTYQIVNEKDWS